RNLQEGGYLLRQLVRCGRCGCSCSALTSKQTYGGKVHSSHYYSCLRTTSGFLKQERCSQRRIRADVLDELVWEEVNTRLQNPALVLRAYQDRKTRRSGSSAQDEPTQKDDRLKEQIKLANKELSRLLDAYQCGALELAELQKRRQLVNSKIEMLNREQELLRKIAAEEKKESDIKAGLVEFAALVSNNLKRISFENKQKLLRIVLEKIVVKDWRVDVVLQHPTAEAYSNARRKSVNQIRFTFRMSDLMCREKLCAEDVHSVSKKSAAVERGTWPRRVGTAHNYGVLLGEDAFDISPKE